MCVCVDNYGQVHSTSQKDNVVLVWYYYYFYTRSMVWWQRQQYVYMYVKLFPGSSCHPAVSNRDHVLLHAFIKLVVVYMHVFMSGVYICWFNSCLIQLSIGHTWCISYCNLRQTWLWLASESLSLYRKYYYEHVRKCHCLCTCVCVYVVYWLPVGLLHHLIISPPPSLSSP